MAMTLITTNTSSDAAESVFSSSIDSTYKLYIFKLYDVNPATDNNTLKFNFSVDGGSNYLESDSTSGMITTCFSVTHEEDDSATTFDYQTSLDLPYGAHGGHKDHDAYFMANLGNGGDESGAGELYLFNPSNTTYVKHFYGTSTYYQNESRTEQLYVGGYANTTSAINAVRFKLYGGGNFDAVISMYGVG
jgi:adenine-specific DNA methylase